jgi:arabinose-5-phosphate isomerase
MARDLDGEFYDALQHVLGCSGRVVVCGMGKSGHIGRKISATLTCTGTPSLFLHPGEASHGDLGMVTRDDLLLLISKSGETSELVWLLPHFQRLGVPIIAISANRDSAVAHAATVVLDISLERELCPHNLVPTTSAVCTLAMGDALAIAAMKERGFSAADIARVHPGAPTGAPSNRGGGNGRGELS